jgi:hypothetical protein
MPMALSGITAAYQPKEPVTSSPLPVDEQGNLEISDPKSQAIQQIIERILLKDTDKDRDKESVSQDLRSPSDSVEISTKAMELYRRSAEFTSITLPDGGSLTLSVERSEQLRIEQTTQTQSSDPLVLDLDGNGIQLTDISHGNGVLFDLTGDGIREQVSWVAPNDGLLVYDRNQNGRIDDGKELFGNQHHATDGFAELARFDLDANGMIDTNDPLFTRLKIWQDKNQNGISEEAELSSLDVQAIEAINLQPVGTPSTIAGNLITGYSRVSTAVGTGTRIIGEAWLNYYA